MNTSPCAHFSIRKILGPANRGEAAFPRHHHIILAAGAVDDKHIAVAVKSADDADMAVSRIEHKVARLGIAPVNGGTVAVLCRSPTAMPNDILSAALVVEPPITIPEQSSPKGRTVPVVELPSAVTSIGIPQRESQPITKDFPPQK